jgi:hypothetical protein
MELLSKMSKTKEEQLIEFLENNKDKPSELIASSLGLSISYIRSLIWRIKQENK